MLLIVLLLVISGCSKTCTPERVVEQRAITQTVETYVEEPYTIEEKNVVGQNCIERHYSEMNDSEFSISLGEKEWVEKDTELGESNHLRRIVTIFNGLDEIDAIYLDKIYLYNGTETKRSKHPLMFLVEPKSTRKLYVLWDTQYDPYKDVIVDFTNNTEEIGFTTTVTKICYNETETVNVTKYRKMPAGTTEEITGYDEVVRVKLKSNC
ncbi:TPA: hypothetical protein HA265_08425 [Candidatus Woesearchaeota archaeon]|nr:hypothetical protein [Candidatus Woesearchaeota archaeon]